MRRVHTANYFLRPRRIGTDINARSLGFPLYFPRISPMRWRVLCENLPDMNLSDSKRQKTAKHPHAFLRAVRDNLWGLSDRVLLERAYQHRMSRAWST
jgi:hypothetical protein